MFDGAESPVTQAFGLGVFAEVSDADLDRLESFFFDRGAGCHVEISPLAGVYLTRRLVERGYLPEEQSNVLFQPLPREQPGAANPDIQVRVSPPEESALWGEIALQGWSDEAPEIVDYLRSMAPVIAAREDSVPFLAEHEGQAIACAALCLHEGVAVLAGACTIPAARRRGAQRALLDARLAWAAERGCDVASVVTQPGSSSQRNAQRQGFRIAYTRTKWVLNR
jgi:GNAT superfamily N-acetyltransferase